MWSNTGDSPKSPLCYAKWLKFCCSQCQQVIFFLFHKVMCSNTIRLDSYIFGFFNEKRSIGDWMKKIEKKSVHNDIVRPIFYQFHLNSEIHCWLNNSSSMNNILASTNLYVHVYIIGCIWHRFFFWIRIKWMILINFNVDLIIYAFRWHQFWHIWIKWSQSCT